MAATKNKTHSIFIGIVIFFVLGAIAFFVSKQFLADTSGVYYAVYLRSGDVYFGTLTRSPKLMLGNAYALVKNDNNKDPFRIVKVTDMAWGPKGELELNQKQALWIAELAEDGTVMKYIKSQAISN